jgi:hypothetical protein
MAAIFDFPLSLTSDSVHCSLIVLLDPENTGLAVGISLLSCIQAEICVALTCFISTSSVAAIFDFSLSLTSDSVHTTPIVLLYPENMGVAVEISLLSFLECEI